MIAYLFDGDSIYQINQTNDSLWCKCIESPVPPGAAVACFGSEEFYFIDFDSSSVLQRYGSLIKSVEYPLPGPAHNVIVHQQKVYCCGVDCLYVFDPLCAEVETLELDHNVVDIEGAMHGFVFVDNQHALYAFHFNDGVKKVEINGQTARLLGRYRHFVVALIDSSRILCVNECGEIQEGLFTFPITTSFLFLDSGAVLTCQEGNKLCLYAQDTLVASTDVSRPRVRLFSVPFTVSEETCLICLCDFADGDGVTLDCGHRFHRDCIVEFSSRADFFRMKGEHIVFTYAVCPGGCGHLIRHTAAPLSAYMAYLYCEIRKDAQKRLLGSVNKTAEDLLYYICCRCEKPFYGGDRRCFRSLTSEPVKSPDELICPDCNEDFSCQYHNRDFVFYKCRYCCNPATNLSFGNRYMCDRCDRLWESSEPESIACPGIDECPLMEPHTEDGSFPIGCMLCILLNSQDGRSFFSFAF